MLEGRRKIKQRHKIVKFHSCDFIKNRQSFRLIFAGKIRTIATVSYRSFFDHNLRHAVVIHGSSMPGNSAQIARSDWANIRLAAKGFMLAALPVGLAALPAHHRVPHIKINHPFQRMRGLEEES